MSSPLNIIDTHQHLWEAGHLQLDWLQNAPERFQATHSTKEYLKAAEGCGIGAAVYMEVDVALKDKRAEVDFITHLCEPSSTPTIAAVVGGWPADPSFKAHLEYIKENPYVKGVRQVIHDPPYPRGFCLTPAFIEGVQCLGAANLIFDVCIRPSELIDVVSLAKKCPDTRFIIDHCGNADPYVVAGVRASGEGPNPVYHHSLDQWLSDMKELAAQPNVVACKVSGIIARAESGWTAATLAPTVNYCIDIFGPDRVIFGSDWPVCTLGHETTLAGWVGALMDITREMGVVFQEKLFRENAMRIYGLTV